MAEAQYAVDAQKTSGLNLATTINQAPQREGGEINLDIET